LRRGYVNIRKINIESVFSRFTETFSPKIVADLNGQQVKLVRAEGDKVPWHSHAKEDEMFLVLEGVLDIIWQEGQAELHPWEFLVIPKGTPHRVVPKGHVKLLLFEPATTEHTGTVRAEITKDRLERLT
jgi:mannose-6-phosphate isomerase-like protein (cupin superfamily)